MLLNLDSQRKVWMEQGTHFDEFFIWPHELYFQKNPNFFKELIEEARALEEEEKREEERLLRKAEKEKAEKKRLKNQFPPTHPKLMENNQGFVNIFSSAFRLSKYLSSEANL